MDYATQSYNFDEWRQFNDRPADDRRAGPARAVQISGRCADCWGSVSATKDKKDQWNGIRCLVCGCSVDGDDAAHEVDAMQREADDNMGAARVGRPAKYRADANFVLKLMPDMDRDKGKMDRRVEDSLARERRRDRLTRHDVPPGTAGYLYAQAQTFLAGVENLSVEKSAIALSDLGFGEPQVVNVDGSQGSETVRLTAKVPFVHRKPSGREQMQRMGTALVAGMAAAFACEVGMKAILITRLDEATKTHDLLKLHRELPEDSRRRLAGDFPTISEVLGKYGQTFGKWRYFEQGGTEKAIGGLIDTDRVWELGKTARVIADECTVNGLGYEIKTETTFGFTCEPKGMRSAETRHLSLKGDEAAVPWEEILRPSKTDGRQT